MHPHIDGHSAHPEVEELQVVVADLARYPRLANLLRYLGEKYLQDKIDEINEFDIATKVFGRAELTFDGSRDSIARVETHRLRKKLKEYYETTGKEHAIHISIPSRTYIPQFDTHTASIYPASAELELEAEGPDSPFAADLSPSEAWPKEPTSTEMELPLQPVLRGRQRRFFIFGIAALTAICLLAIAAWSLFSRYHPLHSRVTGGLTSTRLSEVATTSPAMAPIRLLAGYQGTPRIDTQGDYWTADRYFHGGIAYERSNVSVAQTSDQFLFEHWRAGDFSYDIPLAPGPYELHLFFVAQSPEDTDVRTFFLDINRRPFLMLDINSDALGINIADERILKDVYPDKDGYLHLGFRQDRTSPSLNAIEILPGTPHRQLPVRLIMQPTSFTDHLGNRWHADNYFQGGKLTDFPRLVSGTPDPNLYAYERWGHFMYSIPVDPHGQYSLVLHFAELYWGSQASGTGGVNSRVFSVYCNGSTLLSDFDIFKEAGSLHAVTKTFSHLQPTSSGRLNLFFEPKVNFATISAIEVIDESK